MSEELGKIEKPSVDEFKKGRKLYFIPLIYCGEDSPTDYLTIYEKYWEQVERQISDLEAKLGKINKVFHELVAFGGEEGSTTIKELNSASYNIIKLRLDNEARLEAIEESEILTEFMDWNKCLAMGIQNQKVFTQIYESLLESIKKRNDYIAKKIDESLKSDEIGVLIMREGHQIQFPPDIQIFYVAPPALDEIQRWLRDYKPAEKGKVTKAPKKKPGNKS